MPVTREEATQDDTTRPACARTSSTPCANLSTNTGGFLVTQTNDFGRPLARIGEDVRGYYEASYAPTPGVPGQFRRIEVSVARKDMRVQSRSGYYTTPPPAAGAFEALAGAELPAEIEVRSRFYRFGRAEGGPFDCLIKIEASLARAEFEQDPAKGRLAGKMALVGRVLDATGDVVETFAQEVALGGSPEQMKRRASRRCRSRAGWKLAPGSYTVELVAATWWATGRARSASRSPCPRRTASWR